MTLFNQTISPCHTAGAYHVEHTGVCVCPCKSGLRAYSRHASVVRSCWVWSVYFQRVQFKWRQLTLVFRNELTEMLRWCSEMGAESMLAGERLWGAAWLSVKNRSGPPLTKGMNLMHTIPEKKQRAYPPCASSKIKRKKKICVKIICCIEERTHVAEDTAASSSLQSHNCSNRWAFKTSFFIDSITRQLFSWPHPFIPASTPLFLSWKWSFVPLLNLITSLTVSELACWRAASTVLASSISYYWCIISRPLSPFIKRFWNNVNRLENWDIYEV